MAGVRMEQPAPTCDCIPALFHEITVVADAGQTGSSCFAPRSPVTDAGTACTPGMGSGALLLSLISVCSPRVGTKSPQKHPLSWRMTRGTLAEGVKRRGRGDKTQRAAGPRLPGPVAPLIRPSALRISDVHFPHFSSGNQIYCIVLDLRNGDIWGSCGK